MPENPVTPDRAADLEKTPAADARPEEPKGPAQDAAKPEAASGGKPSAPAAPAAEAPAPKPSPPAPAAAPKPAAAGAKPAPPRPAGARPAPPPKKPEPNREEIDAARAKAVALFEEKKRLGEEVTVTVEHKSITFTGHVVRIEPEDGFVVLEHVDGRRKGLYFILGGHAEAKDGQKVEFPVDGVPR